ncbi:MAG: ArsR/SmtB family transcription factor [Pyrinomonadaceae bacterium]
MDATQFHRIAKALADPRRFEIYETIAQAGDEMCCGAIVDCFPVSQATVSHHLKELADAGLVETRAAGQFKYLRTRPDVLDAYIEELRRRARLTSTPASRQTKAKTRRAAISRGA